MPLTPQRRREILLKFRRPNIDERTNKNMITDKLASSKTYCDANELLRDKIVNLIYSEFKKTEYNKADFLEWSIYILDNIGYLKTKTLFNFISKNKKIFDKYVGFSLATLRLFLWKSSSINEFKFKISEFEKFLRFLDINNVNPKTFQTYWHDLFFLNKDPFDLIKTGLYKYSDRVARILSEPFPSRRLKEFYNNLNNVRKLHHNEIPILPQQIKKIADENNLVYYKNGVYRNITKKQLEIWQDLLNKNISVEPIVGIEDNPTIDLKKIVNPQNNELIVRSGLVGETVIRLTNRLTIHQKMQVANQMIMILSQLWENGYYHGHPHASNFTIVFQGNYPKVYLIDLIRVTKTKSRADLELDAETFVKQNLEYLFNHENKFINLYLIKLMNKVNKLYSLVKK